MTLSRVYPVDGILGKLCPRCETWKPLTEWQRDNTRRRDGFQAYCKDCRKAEKPKARERAAKWYAEHREYVSLRDKEKRLAGRTPPRTPLTQEQLEGELASRVAESVPRILAYERNWEACNHAERLRQRREQHARAPEKGRVRGHRHYWRHRDDIITKRALRYNPAKSREYTQRWLAKAKAENPDLLRIKNAIQRRRRENIPGSHTKADIHHRFVEQNGECAYCGADLTAGYHVEHIIPVIRGGSDNPDNLCLACPTCNHRKHAKTAEEFLARERRLGRLL